MSEEIKTIKFGLWMSRFTVMYPFLVLGMVWGQSAGLPMVSDKTMGWIEFLSCPMCLICLFDLILATAAKGRTRVEIFVLSVLGLIFNAALAVLAAISAAYAD